ncbi:hypothetical protein LG3211_0090 [Lysobacter gummosus]|nr:hypothetical protein LG3211_0090 [Lysobacter gummosus]
MIETEIGARGHSDILPHGGSGRRSGMWRLCLGVRSKSPLPPFFKGGNSS